MLSEKLSNSKCSKNKKKSQGFWGIRLSSTATVSNGHHYSTTHNENHLVLIG